MELRRRSSLVLTRRCSGSDCLEEECAISYNLATFLRIRPDHTTEMDVSRPFLRTNHTLVE